jgi:hypothetical protein
MQSNAHRRAAALVAATLTLTASRIPKADEQPPSEPAPIGVEPGAPGASKEECLSAYERTQASRKEGRLIAAREAALVCAQASCPSVLRDDCAGWSVELERTIPTITLVVVEPDGRDATDVAVTLDGAPIRAHLDGRAVPLDPGPHVIKVTREGQPPISRDVVAHEGDKTRKIRIVVAERAPAPVTATSAPVAETTRPIPTATWVFAGIGAAGLIGFAAFGFTGDGKKSELEGCRPNCSRERIDSAKLSYAMADASLGVAVVGFGLSALFYALRPAVPARPAVPNVGLSISDRHAGATFGWAF